MLQVITNVTNSGFRIVSIISDINIVNRKSFMLISGSDTLRPYIINPVKPSQKIFILFDTVHLLKCVRNKWPNIRNDLKTFVFPDMYDNSKSWNASNNTIFLKTETFKALSHTINAMVYMIHDLLNNNILDYILIGKFQIDNLESRFGQYRQLSAVIIWYQLQIERKLRIKGLLKFHTKSCCDINVKTFIAKFSEVKKDKRDLNFITNFPFDDIDVTTSDELSALLMVTGYVSKKSMARIECIPCKQKFGSTDLPIDLEASNDSLTYFNTINRGGLTYPPNLLFHTVQCAYNIFNICI